MPQIIPIRDLKNTSQISEICHSSNEPVFVTKNGYGDMVIMSMEAYEKTIYMSSVYDKLAKAEMDNYFLKGQIAADQRFGALEKQISTISCNMLKKPDVTGIGAVCPNAGIINGLGIESSAQVARGYNYGCGCNGNYPLV